MDRKLINYLPAVIAEVKDYQELMKTEQVEIEKLWQKAHQALENQFIESTDEQAIGRYELMLNISPKATDDLELRRFRVLSRYNEQLPYTYAKMMEQLKALCGENGVKVELNGLSLTVKVELAAKGKVDEVRKLLDRMIPANVMVDVMLLYNQWKQAKGLKWGQVKNKTWGQLRNEVL
ncbi:MAG: DUF2313 domain-containing protein [Eubacteriales bacterium]|nr:DUF2313 domain-containing protein [Eubacteriales bacterium]